MDYLIRFSQSHEDFRLPEVQALADLEGIPMKVIFYKLESPFCVVNLPSADAARKLVRRAILVFSIHELWGFAPSGEYSELHASTRERAAAEWPKYGQTPFKFDIDAYQHTRTMPERLGLIESFGFLSLKGPIDLKNPGVRFTIFEDWPFRPSGTPLSPHANRLFIGRWLGNGSRDAARVYDLKKRAYISTTSMDSELALVTANIAHAAPGRIFYDPFVGTGSFPVAAAHFGALAFGSDIDGRSIRGKGGKKSLRGNFAQYGLETLVGDFFTADLTNTPLQVRRWLDGIVCDPPYGVREGLKVLGTRDGDKREPPDLSADRTWKSGGYIPPKKPYSFLAMLDDILQFATDMLVDNGRLSFWMPTANDQDQEIAVPTHPSLVIVSMCVQPFNKWSRRLITYRRLPDSEVDAEKLAAWKRRQQSGTTADELNPFRENYFKGFRKDEAA
ncbi:tRNA guanosine-2'-O-methyltransferase TRM11 [Plectosphaerella plurivora]|uniref:tRNA (guanine(10)-N(2))-methyltransferase n=1 Tax=Plectosphaerella plurivora TaxID=936078 RepID=A0A9P9A3D4_9PEZI|nr:tRNA guanosine-2'-O-methyltransferase TRM11 [Plectosphaerella plurivora]